MRAILLVLPLLAMAASAAPVPPKPDQMVCIPGGKFLMGDAMDNMPNALPMREVQVDEFLISNTEVTGPLWDSVIAWGKMNGYDFDNPGKGQCRVRDPAMGNHHPVQTLTWYDAVKWCNARSEMEKLKPCYHTNAVQNVIYRVDQLNIAFGCVDWNANGYRLPTEAEWEKAARGGLAGKRFPWGDSENEDVARRYANYQHPGNLFMIGKEPWTSPVGSFLPNGFNLFDMGGNVMEWTWDVYVADYYNAAGNGDNPKGPDIVGRPSGILRSLRGGMDRNPNKDINNSRCAIRAGMNPGQKHMYLGLRPVRRDIPQVPASPVSEETGQPPADQPENPAPAGMVCIPGGGFPRGDNLDGLANANPTGEVAVDAFFIDESEVPMTLWQAVSDWGKANGYVIEGGKAKGKDHPVHSLTWHDAVKWCNARSEMEKRKPCYHTDAARIRVYKDGKADLTAAMVDWSANGYRLPTEAEWEKAARGGLNGKRFPWGNIVGEDKKANYGYAGNPARKDGAPYTTPVKSYPANNRGLFDMAGNVMEWTWDVYATDSYKAGNNDNPKGPATGGSRVLRGGSWDDDIHDCRCAARHNRKPDYSDTTIGFRTVRGKSE